MSKQRIPSAHWWQTAGRLRPLAAEYIALTVGLAQTLRGDTADPNTAAMCILALARITGKHDWMEEA